MDTQHCLTIAAGFIAIIAACATLITSANNKAENLTTRIRELMRERRERSQDASRCTQLEKQVCLFRARFFRIQTAQSSLFFTITAFILAFAVFIGFGLYLIYKNVDIKEVVPLAQVLTIIIGIIFIAGTVSMMRAIYYQINEVKESHITIEIETQDCPELDTAEIIAEQSSTIAKAATV
jgi:hypothetical protein